MKILYDFQIFSVQKYGGISRYFSELIKSKHDEKSVSILISFNEYFKKVYILNYFIKFRYIRAGIYVINKIYSIILINFGKYDLLHPTYYDSYFIKYSRKPYVLTIYDMIHEKLPSFFPETYTSKNKKMLAEKALKIIAISENTKKDIIDILKVDPEKIEVIYLASSIELTMSTKPIELPDKYVLFVGDRYGYKNFDKFIIAFSNLVHYNQDIELVCVGGGEFSVNERERFIEIGIQSIVTHVDVLDRAMSLYYSNAELFVFPSLYEGFGMPILEAFVCRCPIALSQSSCFPEIAQDAAVYFDPIDPNSIEKAMFNIINSKELRQELIIKGVERSKDFSWNLTRQNTSKLYQKCMNSMMEVD